MLLERAKEILKKPKKKKRKTPLPYLKQTVFTGIHFHNVGNQVVHSLPLLDTTIESTIIITLINITTHSVYTIST